MSLFITGTDTGVGKTVLTGQVVRALRERGHPAWPFKPVQTGWAPGDPLSALDAAEAARIAGLDAHGVDLDLLSPLRFASPCSPHLAAERENRAMDLAPVREAWTALHRDGHVVVAEGAGGLLVPLSRTFTILDLMHEWEVPVLVAARPGLGTINHTGLTLRALAETGLTCTGFVFMEDRPGSRGDLWMDNARVIEDTHAVPFRGLVPWTASGTPDAAAGEDAAGLATGASLRAAWSGPHAPGKYFFS